MQTETPQTLKKKFTRYAPQAVTLVGAVGVGALLMSRKIDKSAYLVSVPTGVLAAIKRDNEALIFETPVFGSYALTAVTKQ